MKQNGNLQFMNPTEDLPLYQNLCQIHQLAITVIACYLSNALRIPKYQLSLPNPDQLQCEKSETMSGTALCCELVK